MTAAIVGFALALLAVRRIRRGTRTRYVAIAKIAGTTSYRAATPPDFRVEPIGAGSLKPLAGCDAPLRVGFEPRGLRVESSEPIAAITADAAPRLFRGRFVIPFGTLLVHGERLIVLLPSERARIEDIDPQVLATARAEAERNGYLGELLEPEGPDLVTYALPLITGTIASLAPPMIWFLAGAELHIALHVATSTTLAIVFDVLLARIERVLPATSDRPGEVVSLVRA